MKMIIIFISLAMIYNFVFAQNYDLIGREFMLTSKTRSSGEDFTVVSNSKGGFLFAYQKGKDIYGQIVDSNGNPEDDEFQIECKAPIEIIVLKNTTFAIFWSEENADQSDAGVYMRLLDNTGVPISQKMEINDEAGSYEFQPKAVKLKNGNFVVCWQSYAENRSPRSIFYGQLFTENWEKKNDPFKITSMDYGGVSLSALENDRFVYCIRGYWTYCHILDERGNKKADTPRIADIEDIRIVALNDGYFVMTYFRDYNIYAQKYDRNGIKAGDEILINTYPVEKAALGSQSYAQAINAFKDEKFLVCWSGKGKYRSCILAQLFDKDGNKLFDEFEVNTVDRTAGIFPKVIILDQDLSLVIWRAMGTGMYSYGINGKYMSTEPLVYHLDEFNLLEPGNDATVDTADIRFRWQQPNSNTKSYAYEILYDLYLDTDPDFSHPIIYRNIIDTTYLNLNRQRGQTYFWKVLAKNIAGEMLWSKQMNWGFFIKEGGTSVESADCGVPKSYCLLQNYPNPFNPGTNISYILPESKENRQVNLTIHDILGRQVKVLVKEKQNASVYTVIWDGTNTLGQRVPSGVYVVTMQAGDFKQSRKMILMK
ncbi:T9SS type A sorting domain-containing protein [candidate division KSB1 bacterium]|nr:T9SS type A sorting domain-containing protein [candidate division KSB1 bacterium]